MVWIMVVLAGISAIGCFAYRSVLGFLPIVLIAGAFLPAFVPLGRAIGLGVQWGFAIAAVTVGFVAFGRAKADYAIHKEQREYDSGKGA